MIEQFLKSTEKSQSLVADCHSTASRAFEDLKLHRTRPHAARMVRAAAYGLLFVCLFVAAACSSKAVDSPHHGAASPHAHPPTADTGVEAQKEAEFIEAAAQLTYDGLRSGEGYFSADGKTLVFQSERLKENPFYQIYLLGLEDGNVQRVSAGNGKTTCGWLHPDSTKVLFASTHTDPYSVEAQQAELAERASGKKRRYSWDYDPEYDLYVRKLHTGSLTPRVPAKGYDAEGSWSPDGKEILFASNRHAYAQELSPEEQERLKNDPSYFIDLYLTDGRETLTRLTDSPGYDGGPFFSADGRMITWRRFAEDGSRSEVYVMKRDGSDQRRLTSLGAISWAPFFHPSGDYLIFATNLHGFDNFELYLVRTDGEGAPVRVTYTPGFDGLPAFSPDGQFLAWTSNRTHNKTSQIFLGRWNDAHARAALGLETGEPGSEKEVFSAPPVSPAELRTHVEILASPEFRGRLTGTKGEERAVAYAAEKLRAYGLKPAGERGTYYQHFDFTAGVSVGKNNRLTVHTDGSKTGAEFKVEESWRPLSFSGSGPLERGGVVFAGYGIVAPAATGPNNEPLPEYDSYAHLDVKDRYVLVFRHLPEDAPEAVRKHLGRHASLRYKAMVARDRGARGLIIVSGPLAEVSKELVPLRFDAAHAETSLAVLSVTDSLAEALLQSSGRSLQELQQRLEKGAQQSGFPLAGVELEGNIQLVREQKTGRNVLAMLPATQPSDLGAIVVGAHIDHLGQGGSSASLAVGEALHNIHFGADDNASGVAAALELAGRIAALQKSGELTTKRDLIIALWSGEELGLLGSSSFVEQLLRQRKKQFGLGDAVGAYLNMDMVGRLEKNLILQGIGSSSVWTSIIEQANAPVRLPLSLQDESYLPTDATAFYLQEVPILSAFTGAHKEYHTPADTPEKLNYEGLARVSWLMERAARALLLHTEPIDYKKMEKPTHFGERAFLRAYLGTVPDYASSDIIGVRLAGVAANGPAEAAGLKAGDIVVELAGKKVENIYDYTYAIEALKVNEPVRIVIERSGERLEREVTPGSRE